MSTKIMVISDNVVEQTSIKRALSSYDLLFAESNEEVLNLLRENSDIKLAIVDIESTHICSFTLLNNLIQLYNLHAIILANNDDVIEIKMGLELGAASYILKPFSVTSLRTIVDLQLEAIKRNNEKFNEPRIAFDQIFEDAPIGIAITFGKCPFVEGNHKFYRVNKRFEQITGRKKTELKDLSWKAIVTPEDFKAEADECTRIKPRSCSLEVRIIKPDGNFSWVNMFIIPISGASKSSASHICFVYDITSEKMTEYNLQESERSKEVLLTHLPGLAFRCHPDEQWTMQFVSNGSYNLTGYYPESFINNRDLAYIDLIAPEYRELIKKERKRALANNEPFKYEYEIITAKGQRKWVIEMGQGICNDYGEIVALEGIILDISDRKKVENSLRYYFEHDRWTDLENRNVLERVLYDDFMQEVDIKRAVVGINLGAIYLLTMSYGFYYTQEYMRTIAESLQTLCSENKTLYNTYENRFVFYIKDYKDKEELAVFCEKLKATLKSLLGTERIGGGIGVVEIDKDNEHNVDLILKNLLIASERAVNGRPTDFEYCFFDAEMEIQLKREKDIQHELMQIATTDSNGGIYLLYQPIVDLGSNRIYGFEALARLKTEKYGIVSPLEFIPIAEKTKLIVPLGEKIIYIAFGFLNKLAKQGYGDINISINVSASQLLEGDFAEDVFRIIDEMNVCPDNITFEITESVYVANYGKINDIIAKLRCKGIHIAIDDFGRGYSSLAAELGLRANCLKIDKFFIDALMTGDPDKAITSDIISMAHKLGHYVIAEGVEHEEQKKYLVHYGCEKIQGFLFSKPVEGEKAIELLKESGTL